MERRTAEEMLRDLVDEAGSTADHAEQVVIEGMVPSEIIKTLSSSNVDLLMISPERVHRGLDHFLLGSNSEALMLGSPCPTLTVGPDVPERREAHATCHKVIYISDLSTASATAAVFANRIGRAFGVETEVYQLASHVTRHETLKLQDALARYTNVLKRIDDDLPVDWYTSEFHASRLYAEDEVIEKAMEPSNLVVLGVQSASFLQRHLHTSFAYRVLAKAASPVLSIPEKLSPHLSVTLQVAA